MTDFQAYPWEAPVSEKAGVIATRFQEFVPELETKRLRLRAPVLADFPGYADIVMSDRASGMGGPFDREEALLDFSQYVAGWLLRGTGLWAVETRADETLIGFVLVGMEYGDPAPELGYLFKAEVEGNGYATEAAEAARDFALRDLEVPVLISCVDKDNSKSAAVAQRLGGKVDNDLSDETVDIFRHASDLGPIKGVQQ